MSLTAPASPGAAALGREREAGSEESVQREGLVLRNACDYKGFFDNEALSDVVCTVAGGFGRPGKSYHCHKILLASSSNFFSRMFLSGRFAESSKFEIAIDEEDAVAFELYLKFLYEGLRVEPEDTEKLMAFGKYVDKIDSEFLKESLRSAISPVSAIALVSVPFCEEDCLPILEQTFESIRKHPNFVPYLGKNHLRRLAKSLFLRVSSEKVVFDTIVQWINHHAAAAAAVSESADSCAATPYLRLLADSAPTCARQLTVLGDDSIVATSPHPTPAAGMQPCQHADFPAYSPREDLAVPDDGSASWGADYSPDVELQPGADSAASAAASRSTPAVAECVAAVPAASAAVAVPDTAGVRALRKRLAEELLSLVRFESMTLEELEKVSRDPLARHVLSFVNGGLLFNSFLARGVVRPFNSRYVPIFSETITHNSLAQKLQADGKYFSERVPFLLWEFSVKLGNGRDAEDDGEFLNLYLYYRPRPADPSALLQRIAPMPIEFVVKAVSTANPGEPKSLSFDRIINRRSNWGWPKLLSLSDLSASPWKISCHLRAVQPLQGIPTDDS
eukprot:TRINITY_DN3872_c0_g1_i1.p1 TRINITY_DN3872_c0_g1~~TRINITY_DN3872_c0_g1_i1.p1  ORF type:complete len:563 (+),score=170.33 TRINITY_DN3872_c0_g1_i1:173-1861(+)